MFGHQDDPKDPANDNGNIGNAFGSDSSAPTSDNTNDPSSFAAPSVPLPTPGSNVSAGGSDALLDIKQHALQQLTPLVGHLDQSPEEKFRTTMMMIQASDNQDLIKEAYEAANSISDEKAKAQALLDIVNEINYFTQHGK